MLWKMKVMAYFFFTLERCATEKWFEPRAFVLECV